MMEGHIKELSLFAPKPCDASVVNARMVPRRPIQPLTDEGNAEFTLDKNGEDYIDLKKTKLYMRVKIVRKDGKPLKETDKVAFVNAPLHAFWRQVDLYIGDKLVSSRVSTNYAIKAFIDIITNYEEDVKESQLQALLFHKDTSGHMDINDPSQAGTNLGLKQRFAYTKKGNEVEMEGTLLTDLSMQDKLILNNTKISFVLHPTEDAFRLMSPLTDTYATQLVSLQMKFCKVKVEEAIRNAHEAALNNSPALYHISQSLVHVGTALKGATELIIENPHASVVPSLSRIALVSNAAYRGDFQRNPFNFHHYGLKEIKFTVDGDLIGGEPLKLNFKTGKYIEAYNAMFSALGMYDTNESNYITREDFVGGSAFFFFDKFGYRGKAYQHKTQTGNTSLSLSFADPLPEAVSAVVYSNVDSIMTIDKSRHVKIINKALGES